MKAYILSFELGIAVGLLYAALRVKGPAPPLVALVGLLSMVWSEEGYQRIVTLITSLLGAIGDPGVLIENKDQRSASQRLTGTVGAIGPGSLWDTGHLMLYANAYHEVGAVNWPEGNKLVLRLQWLPNRKGSTKDDQ